MNPHNDMTNMPTPDKSLPHIGPISVLGYIYKTITETTIVSIKLIRLYQKNLTGRC